MKSFCKVLFQPSKVVDIVIEIEDVNDNKPTFFRRNIPVNITESYTSGDFVSLDADMAVDQDSGDYLYSLKLDK